MLVNYSPATRARARQTYSITLFDIWRNVALANCNLCHTADIFHLSLSTFARVIMIVEARGYLIFPPPSTVMEFGVSNVYEIIYSDSMEMRVLRVWRGDLFGKATADAV